MRGWPLIKLLPQKTNFRFVKYAPIAGVISVILCVAAIVGCLTPERLARSRWVNPAAFRRTRGR